MPSKANTRLCNSADLAYCCRICVNIAEVPTNSNASNYVCSRGRRTRGSRSLQRVAFDLYTSFCSSRGGQSSRYSHENKTRISLRFVRHPPDVVDVDRCRLVLQLPRQCLFSVAYAKSFRWSSFSSQPLQLETRTPLRSAARDRTKQTSMTDVGREDGWRPRPLRRRLPQRTATVTPSPCSRRRRQPLPTPRRSATWTRQRLARESSTRRSSRHRCRSFRLRQRWCRQCTSTTNGRCRCSQFRKPTTAAAGDGWMTDVPSTMHRRRDHCWHQMNWRISGPGTIHGYLRGCREFHGSPDRRDLPKFPITGERCSRWNWPEIHTILTCSLTRRRACLS